MSLEIHQLFDKIDKVPQVPEVVRTLVTQVNASNVSFSSIAETVEKEQIISLKVLRLVNSAHYSFPRKIGSIQQALVILGMDELKKLVITSGFINSYSNIEGMSLDDFWIDNFRTASYAKWLAERSNQEDSGMVFTAGLINSLGSILIHLKSHELTTKINFSIEEGLSHPDADRQHLGFTNQQVCGELCRRWQFSEELIETIIQSAEPLTHSDISRSACTILVAKYISESNHTEHTKQEIRDNFPTQAWIEIGFEEQDIEEYMLEMLALDTGIEGLLD